MADYIDREELLKYAVGLEENVKVVFEDVIEDMPSVDAVEVVRCKDCKYNGKPYCDLLTTGSRDWYINDNDYCKWGEKE